MCRLFCYISDSEPQLLADILIKPHHSIIKQIDAHYLPSVHIPFQPNDESSPNLLTNVDGFGIGWFTSAEVEFADDASDVEVQDDDDALRPVVYKNTRPPLNDLNLRSICRGTKSRGLLAHIRAATGLTPVVETNNHPFSHAPYLFAHNGVLSNFASLRIRLLSSLSAPARDSILGTTDSEHLCAMFFDRLGREEGGKGWEVGKRWDAGVMRRVLRAVLRELEGWVEDARQEERKAGNPGKPDEHSALNLIITDGVSLLATRYASPSHEPPSLYISTTAGSSHSSKFRGHPDLGLPRAGAVVAQEAAEGKPRGAFGKHVIVASEPSTYDDREWALVRSGGLVWVGRDMVVHEEDI